MFIKLQIKKFKRKFFSGQLLVELLIAIGLSVIILPALLTGLVASREGGAQETQRVKGVAFLREGVDAARSVKNKIDNWLTFAVNGTYHPVISGSAWTMASGSETVNGLTRQIVISSVNRDNSGNIVSSGGTVDPSTKKVVVTVSWTKPHSSNISTTLYFSRYSSYTYSDTTAANFNAGTKTGVAVTSTSGGEVTLGAGGGGDWCAPNLSIAALDLPKNGVANAISAIEGKVAAGTGENASGVAFASIAVANTNPPTSSITGTFDSYKTNGVFTEANYAYLATDNNSKEMVIIDLTNKNPVTGKYAEVGYFNAPGNLDGLSVYVSGNVGYLSASNDTLYTINLSSKSGSRAQLGSKSLPATGTRVVVVGEYAYVSIAGDVKELQVIRSTSGGATLTNYGYADVNGEAAYDVSVNNTGTRAYLATGNSSSLPEFFIINTSNKTSSNPSFSNVGSYNASGMDPEGVAVVTGNKAILVGTGAEEYQVIDITNEASPTRCGGLQVNNGIHGLASVVEGDGDVYSYLITGDSATELKIIQGGPGIHFTTSGTFESRTFTNSFVSAFNYLSFTITEPSGSDIKLQVATNNDNATWTYKGPDGTGGTFYEAPGTIPLSVISGTYFRYKAFLSGDGNATPTLYDTTINYSY